MIAACLANFRTPEEGDTALTIRDQFQSFEMDGVNLSVFTSTRDP